MQLKNTNCEVIKKKITWERNQKNQIAKKLKNSNYEKAKISNCDKNHKLKL